jgi:hypothetical protein
MSRTYRKQPLRNQFRHPKTLNELRQVSDNYNDTQYPVSTRNRYIPTLMMISLLPPSTKTITTNDTYRHPGTHHS